MADVTNISSNITHARMSGRATNIRMHIVRVLPFLLGLYGLDRWLM